MKLKRTTIKQGYDFDFKVINGVLFSEILINYPMSGHSMNDIYTGTSNWANRMDDIQDIINAGLFEL